MKSREDYVFFWKTNEIHGWASQWYYSPFTVTIDFGGETEAIEFLTAEHWMMVQKALLFKDYEIAREMLKIKEVNQKTMAQVKALGRKVKNFDDKKWKEAREKIVFEGNVHKFRQNEELREKLVKTGERSFVEASPRDRIWGIGFGEKNAMNSKERWGQNLLGKALDEVRGVLTV
ncbi:hypothetical protein AMATHDRAFT_144878 [Amanita thiersii Skay4041]|uniref:NADAR domain-containing protein n=1 Tax=Amanita thiersii Skay4041 TaxID=703135 RepID=A0A2A9NHP3_9AGAR|nr:hypothetical protein AMATHDRAFT_144878 [Amanita thiersii Skay4041]